jgi:hypothetical protein
MRWYELSNKDSIKVNFIKLYELGTGNREQG